MEQYYSMLLDSLNTCIQRGLLPRGFELQYPVVKVTGNYILLDDGLHERSIHELFSIESGLMEFVERGMPDTFYLGTVGKEEFNRIKIMTHYHYMSQLTGDEKIVYFCENALIPIK